MALLGMERIGATAGETAMVGDRLYTDVEMARQAGLTSVLVLSGEATREDLAELDEEPDYIFPSVRELTTALQSADTT